MTRQVKVSGRKIKTPGIPMWVYENGIDNNYPVRIVDFQNDRCFDTDDYLETDVNALHTFARSGVVWSWQMVAGALELVEIADGITPFSVDPLTGLAVGYDGTIGVTRKNLRYAPTSSGLTPVGGGSAADLALNALGKFAGVKIISAGTTSDGQKSAAVDNASLIALTKYSVDILLRENEASSPIFGLQAETSGVGALLSYTFSTGLLSVQSELAGTIDNEKAEVLLDGTVRVTYDFTPVTTDGYKFYSFVNTTTSGDGFTLLAWFITYWSVQQFSSPTPVLGPEGAIYTTGNASMLGSKSITGDRTIVLFHRRVIQNSNFDYDMHVAGGGGEMNLWSDAAQRKAGQVDDGTNPSANLIDGTVPYKRRLGAAISYTNGIARFAFYDEVNGLSYIQRTQTLVLPDSAIYGIGCSSSGLVPIGGTYEKVLFFDVVLTELQIKEIVQRGF